MDPRFQSSFIPKKPIATSIRPVKEPINLLSLITTVVLIASLVASGAVFLYQNYLNSRIASDQQSLNLTQGQFDPTTINQIIRLDTRINVAKSLLSGHVEFSNLFALLETLTKQTVRFTSLALTTGDQGAINLVLGGEALGFSDIALQTAALDQSTYFKNLVVSNLSVESTGGVSFTMTLNVTPSLIAYVPPSVTQSAPTSATLNSLSATGTSTNTTKP